MRTHIAELMNETSFKCTSDVGSQVTVRDVKTLTRLATQAYSRGDKTLNLELSIHNWIFSRDWRQGKFLKIYIDNHKTPSDSDDDESSRSKSTTNVPAQNCNSVDDGLAKIHIEKSLRNPRPWSQKEIEEKQQRIRRLMATKGIGTKNETISISKPEILPTLELTSELNPENVPPSELNPEIVQPLTLKPKSGHPSVPIIRLHDDRRPAIKVDAANPDVGFVPLEITSSGNPEASFAPITITSSNNNLVAPNDIEIVPHMSIPTLPPSEPPPTFLSYSSSYSSRKEHVIVHHGFDNSMSLPLSSNSGSGGVMQTCMYNPKQEERKERNNGQTNIDITPSDNIPVVIRKYQK
jgi:hypothetical protein